MAVSTNTRLSRKLLRLVMGDPEQGQRIREARKAAGLSQKALADAVGLAHPQSISNAERGVSQLEMVYLRKVALRTSRPLSFFLDPSTAQTDADATTLQDQIFLEMAALRGEVAEVRGMVAELLGRSA